MPTIDEVRAASEAAHDPDTMLAKAYGRGGDYVSQTRAAQKDHESRTERLARARAASDSEGPSESRSGDLPVRGDVEISDAMQTRINRLREFKTANAAGPPRDRQNEAPGGGRTRSR